MTEKDKEDFIKLNMEGLSAPIYTEDIKRKALQKMKFPKYKPAYQSLTLMENGWLVVIVESVMDEYTLFDIFDKEGKYIANFKTPVLAEGVFSSFLFFKNNKAYIVAIEDEYRYVKRYNYEVQEYKDDKWVRKK
ncbi:MAG: hypothetical protein JSV96_06160 [Candidatus Aminicenantes bacterium]|nr:MAG: hypothetical protein JSV96_06160 [Candidatus Aminicenantes bacterium]